jgi:hypothetical protein
MFKKNDPIVDSIKQIMDESRIRRDVETLVNETFGVTSKKGLPHELHAEYDAALKEATEIALTEGMSKLIENKKNDWKKEEVEEEQLDEASTRKHFVATAQTVSAIQDEKERKKHAEIHADRYSKENPRFDRNKFMKACGIND